MVLESGAGEPREVQKWRKGVVGAWSKERGAEGVGGMYATINDRERERVDRPRGGTYSTGSCK